VTTLPGVQPDTSATGAGGSTNVPYFSIQGGMPNQSESSVDGISAQDVRNNRPLTEAYPSSEAILELKVQGVGNTAEYGSAGDISMITKSGTNTYHGSAAWYYQNADFDAIQFGATSKPEKEVNDYAVSLGGPVRLPKIYNGKDRTFFFADFEQLMYPRTVPVQDYVPTAAMKSGNFGNEGQIFPLLSPVPGRPPDPSSSTAPWALIRPLKPPRLGASATPESASSKAPEPLTCPWRWENRLSYGNGCVPRLKRRLPIYPT